MLNRSRTLVLTSTVTLALIILASVLPAQSIATPGAWRLISPTEYTPVPDAELRGIYLTNGGTSGKGSGSGWAVGDGGFIFYWDGFSWVQASSPFGPTYSLCELDAVNFGGPLNPLTPISSTSGWAVGECGGVPKSLYYNGVGWTSYTVPSIAGQVFSVYEVQSATSSNPWVTAFAVGRDGVGGGFWQWNGVPGSVTTWTQDPAPAGAKQVNGVYMTVCTGSPCAATEGIAVGNTIGGFGAIYRRTGGMWTLLPTTPSNFNLNAVAMSSQFVGWAVGDKCTIIRTTNEATWSLYAAPATCGPANNLRSIVLLSASEGWAVGDGDSAGAQPAILHGTSLDSVPSWTRIPIGQIASSGGLDSVTFATSGGNIWAVGKSGVATFCFANCGTPFGSIWSTTTSPNPNQLDSVFMPSDSDGWAVGAADSVPPNEPTVLRWDGGTASWTRYQSVYTLNTPTNLLGVYLSSGSAGWAVGGVTPGPAPATLWYDGSKWQGELVPACACILNSVYMVSDTNSWAVGTGGKIMHSSARGDQVSGQFGIVTSSVPTAIYRSVYFDPTSSGLSGWAVGTMTGTPLIVHTGTGGGDSWPTVGIPAVPATILYSVFIQDSTHGWAAGDGSTILYWNGISWTPVPILGLVNPPITIMEIAVTGGPPATDGWAVGLDNSGFPITIHYDGTSSTWTQVPLSPGLPPFGAALTSLSLRSSTNGLAVGTDYAGFPNSLSLILHLDPPGGVTASNTGKPPSTQTTQQSSNSATSSSTTASASTSSSTSSSTTSALTTTAISTPSTTPATTSTSRTSSVSTPLTLPPIPGFPWESILAGVILGMTALAILRRRRK